VHLYWSAFSMVSTELNIVPIQFTGLLFSNYPASPFKQDSVSPAAIHFPDLLPVSDFSEAKGLMQFQTCIVLAKNACLESPDALFLAFEIRVSRSLVPIFCSLNLFETYTLTSGHTWIKQNVRKTGVNAAHPIISFSWHATILHFFRCAEFHSSHDGISFWNVALPVSIPLPVNTGNVNPVFFFQWS